MVEKDRITKIAGLLKEREKIANQALNQLDEFTPLLYDAIEDVISGLVEAGANVSKLERKRLAGDRESLSFEWGDRKLIFIPLVDTAFPDSDSQVAHIKKPAGRLIVFLQSLDNPAAGTPIYGFYVFPNGLWSALGFGLPWSENSFTRRNLGEFALYFLETLMEKTYRQWRTLRETDFERTSQGLRDPMGFVTLGSD